jgi:uncharacterized protein
MSKIIVVLLVGVFFILVDLYVFQAVKTAFENSSSEARKIAYGIFWGITTLTLIAFFSYHFISPDILGRQTRTLILVGIFGVYFSKLFVILFLLIDDIRRAGKWIFQKTASVFSKPGSEPLSPADSITRSEFLAKAGLVLAAIPAAGMAYGIISGAHDYRIRRKTIALKNLPKAFHGIKVVQISDIHSGSFFNTTAVQGGLDMLMKEKPDMVFFTGDLVNNVASEVKEYIPVFEKVKAPLGVYSTLGNHDYGDYVSWSTKEAKHKNLQTLIDSHKTLGWDILINENRKVKVDREEIGIIGIENWSAVGSFPKYGKMDQAYAGIQDMPVKLLLSHDPSHWEAQVRKDYKDIDIMFAGHTHGFQMGIEIGDFKWSPSQYMYKQWAGLYQQENQYLYVNRGYGYLGFPGRVGMPPEITVITLECA